MVFDDIRKKTLYSVLSVVYAVKPYFVYNDKNPLKFDFAIQSNPTRQTTAIYTERTHN